MERSKKETKRLEKKRARSEKKAQLIADGAWKSSRKRRNQRDFHCETRDTIETIESETKTENRKDGFRYVVPYKHTFEVHVKARWFGKTLLSLFIEEFGGFSETYYRDAIRHGFITLNQLPSTPDHLVKDGDLLHHTMHRHEPSVIEFQENMISYENDEIIVVNKPSTIPVHPCGAYRHNSMVFLLAKDFKKHPLYPVHRLDRLTSGLLVLAKSPEKAQVISSQLIDRSVQKYYYAKVEGEFPCNETSLSPNSPHCILSMVVVDSTNYIQISAPLDRIADLENRHGVTCDGKASDTLVRRVAFDGKHSVLECLPLSGRQHQIRVHLQSIGFPIANDPLYGPSSFINSIPDVSSSREEMSKAAECVDNTAKLEEICLSCKYGDDVTFNWEQLHCEGIWLHAYRYKGDAWDFSVAPPGWVEIPSNQAPTEEATIDCK